MAENLKNQWVAILILIVLALYGIYSYAGSGTGTATSSTDSGINVTSSGSYQIDGVDVIDANGGFVGTGTTTISNSYDGFQAYSAVTVATGTVTTLSRTGSPIMCDGGNGALYFNSTAFSPSLKVSVGTTTEVDLLATTTIATTTDTVVQLKNSKYVVGSGGTIFNVYLADITNTEASSTYYGNWSVELSDNCWILGG